MECHSKNGLKIFVMESSENRPPRLFLKFFRWFCHPDYREEIEGDLIERYENYSEQNGKNKARMYFIKEVILLFKPSLIGNMKHLINSNSRIMTTENKRLIGIMTGIAALLLIPLIAMQFSEEVNWSIFDFIAMGVLLLSCGLLVEIVLRRVKTTRSRIIICGAVLLIFLLVWAELAVGVFGTPFAGN